MAIKILATGATGFLGKHLANTPNVEYLKIGSEFDLLTYKGLAQVLALAEKEGIDGVLHLAWNSNSKFDYLTSSENELWAIASVTLAQECKKRKWKFYFASSASVRNKWKDSPYAIAKSAVVQYLIEQSQELKCAIFELHYIVSISFRRPRLIHSFLTQPKESFVLEKPDDAHDYIMVEDVCDAINLSIEMDLQGIIEIGTGKPTSNRWLINRLNGKELSERELKKFTKGSEYLTADISKLSEIGWQPKKTNAFLMLEKKSDPERER